MVHKYDWAELLEDGKRGKFRMLELRKYLFHHHIRLSGTTKADTVQYISEHLNSQKRDPQPCTKTRVKVLSDEPSDDDELNSEDNLVAGIEQLRNR